MKEIRIEFDYLNGPVWKQKFDAETQTWSTGIDIVDNDKAIEVLNDEAAKMYESLFSFDSNTSGCVFDKAKFESTKSSLLSIVQTLLARLSMLNDGSFTVVDKATPFLNKDVEVTVSECKPSVVDELYGIASNVSMTLDEIRDERLAKQRIGSKKWTFNRGRRGGIIRKLIETLYWHYQEKDNWEMKMNEPIAIRKLSPEEVQEILLKRRQSK